MATPSNLSKNSTLSGVLFEKTVSKPTQHYSQNNSQVFSSNKKKYKNKSYVYDYPKSKGSVEMNKSREISFIDEDIKKRKNG